MTKISELSDQQKCDLVENRWSSSESVWDLITKTYDANLNAYKNNPDWLKDIPRKKSKVRANRIFVDMEAVINSVIANPPKPTVMPGRQTPESKELAISQEKYFQVKYTERNSKETLRKGLRNLYFGRLIVLKKFWDPKINDFNTRALDPRKVRFGKASTKEDDSEFAIEEIEDTLSAVMRRFPKMKKQIMEQQGIADEAEVLINNPTVKYKEAWIRDYLIFKMDNIILGCIKNPYWDWDGILITEDELTQLEAEDAVGEKRRTILTNVKNEQSDRRAQQAQMTQLAEVQNEYQPKDGETLPLLEDQDYAQTYQAYYFNHFDQPRKPYIFATMFNNENTPVGQTDMITQAIPLQENIDETKRDISENAKVVNGTLKVDASVMSKADAQRIRYEAGGIVWGKGVVTGVVRETGQPLPNFVVENMIDSRKEVDDLMASSSAFKGEREGQETKGGRLALIEQSFLRLNELVQVIDYVTYESFNWDYQLAKIKYTEHHYAKTMGKDKAVETLTLIQDDFEDGSEIRVIGGKTLPEDSQFKYEQAHEDVKAGILSPVDYLERAGYDSPMEKAKNRVTYDLNKSFAVGLTPEEMQKISPAPTAEPPKLSLAYADLPPDGQVQLAAKAGITLNPALLIAEKQHQQKADAKAAEAKAKGMEKSPVTEG